MRQTVLIVVASLLLMQSFGCFLRPKRCSSDTAPLDCDEGPIRSESTDQGESISIEDRALLAHLVEQGTRLIDQCRVTEMDTLVKQLDLDRCRLELPEPRPLADDPVEIYARARDSVVVVGGLYECKKCREWHATAASGFLITTSGAVVTNYHVVNNPGKAALVVMTSDRRVFPVRRVLAASRPNDLAILQVDAEGLTPLPIAAASDAAPVGSAVGVISHPARRFYCFTSGVVSRYMKIRAAGAEIDALSITADYAHGSSGAPVLNSKGQVIAIVKSTESIYGSIASGQRKNLQMVFKTCLPAKHLLRLIES
jgi:hypothetical protein